MEEHKIKVKVDTGKSVDDLNKLEKALNDVEAELVPLTSQMGEMEDQLMAMAYAGDTTSDKFVQLSTTVAGMRRTVRETDTQIEALSMTTSQKMGGALGGLTGAFETAQGVMGAFGVESEDVEKMLLKVQSAMAISQGVTAIKESMASFKALGIAIGLTSKAKQVDTAITATQATVTTTATGATTGMTVAQRILNTVMKANPIFLIIGGITALIGAFALFSSSTDEAKESVADLNKELENLDEFLSFDLKQLEDFTAMSVNNAKLRGASSTELLAIEKQNAKSRLDLEFKHVSETIKANDKIANSETASAEESSAAFDKIYKAQRKRIELTREIDVLVSEFALKEKEINDEKVKEEEQRAKEQADKRKSANDKYQADKKSALDAIRALEKEYNDSLLSDHDLEVQKVEEKYAKEIALAKKYKQDTEILESARKTALNEITLRTEIEKQKIIDDLQAEADKQAKERKKEFDDEIRALGEANTERVNQSMMTAQEIELMAIGDKYFQMEQLALGNAEQMAIIAEARGAEEKVINDKYAEDKKAKEKEVFDAKLDLAVQGMQLIAGIAELMAGDDEARQRKAFNIKKAADIVSATVDGYRAVLSTYAQTPGGPILKGVAAGIAGGFAILQIAKIAKTKFTASNTAPPSDLAPPSGGGGGSSIISPEFNIVGNSPTNQLAQLQGQPVQAYVVSGDVTTAQALDRNRIQNATL